MKNTCNLLILLCLMVCGHSESASAQNPSASYAGGKYKEAVEEYENRMEAEGTSVGLLYNLGNAAVKAEDYGKAVRAYKLALNIDPSDGKVKQNLNYVISKVNDRNRVLLKGKQMNVERDGGSFFHSLRTWIASVASPDVWSGIAVGCFILMLAGAALYIFASSTLLRKIGFFGGILLMALTILFNVFAFIGRSDMRDNAECVIMEYRAELSAEPMENAKTVAAPLSAGTLMDVIEKKKDERGETWYKVRLNNEYVGWLRESAVAIL